MYQVSCASCSSIFEYNIEDYIHLCPYCSSGFILDVEEGVKDLIGDHYIIPNRIVREHVEDSFYKWISSKFHKPDKVRNEFKVIGSYGIALPFWIISSEAHSHWVGHSEKSPSVSLQSSDYSQKFVREEGRFSRRYRWAILARKSPKEHWGLERLHHPREKIPVDWDGFPLDESMGRPPDNVPNLYDSKLEFKFDLAAGNNVSGIQMREAQAIAKAKDQITEYHRRVCKTKVNSLFEHRTEVEVIGIHLVHVPFWFLRYAYVPSGFFKYFTPVRERRLLLQGYSEHILDAELPLTAQDKVMTNLFVCGVFSMLSLGLSIFLHPLFFFLFITFAAVCVLSGWQIYIRNQNTTDIHIATEFSPQESKSSESSAQGAA
jgi:hypothetical protein